MGGWVVGGRVGGRARKWAWVGGWRREGGREGGEEGGPLRVAIIVQDQVFVQRSRVVLHDSVEPSTTAFPEDCNFDLGK